MKIKILIIIIFFSNSIFSNELEKLDIFFDLTFNFKYKESIHFLNKEINKDLFFKEDLMVLSNLLYFNGNELENVEVHPVKTENIVSKCINLLNIGYDKLYHKKDNEKVLSYFLEAYSLSKKIKNNNLIKFSLLSILGFYHYEYEQTNKQYEKYLKLFFSTAKTDYDFSLVLINKIYFKLQSINPNDRVIDNEIHQISEKLNNIGLEHKIYAHYYSYLALYNEFNSHYDLALKYYRKSIQLCKDMPFLKFLKSRAYYRIAIIYEKTKKIKESNIYIDSMYLFSNKYDTLTYKILKYKHKSQNYYSIGKYNLAYEHLDKAVKLEYDLNFKENSLQNSKIETELRTLEKEKENLQLKQENLESEVKRKQNQNLFFGALVILFFSGIIYYQNLKNSRKKRLLAEQQKELEQQKNITLIKEQEIVTINAMVNGQEKERIRIAEDLHDNIGSVLATLKLHFENLKLNREKKHFNQDELYQKTEKLIDETYFKVRNLAHAKNAGVIANKGLLTAVKIMAEKITDANKIQIEVLDFGLEKRLENTLELTVFRIIQELTTNIIKHAEAKNATINISAYDNNLNIIIEDNGKGFVFEEKELKADGIGLGSIQTRIEHLKGTFEVDSALGKGTTILMDIPV